MTMTSETRGRRGESGFALILAILALMLLTFLGLTLAATTSTELQIATNFRWSQQAFYNAEAGIELGKRYLLKYKNFNNTVLPAARGTTYDAMTGCTGSSCASTWANTTGHTGAQGEALRTYENADCDTFAHQGYGVVLDDPTQPSAYQNMSAALGQNLNGTFTLWVRRDADSEPGTGLYRDSQSGSKLVLVAEGTAPNTLLDASNMSRRAVRILEVKLQLVDADLCAQENRLSQAGSSPEGSGYNPCARPEWQGVPNATGEPDKNQS